MRVRVTRNGLRNAASGFLLAYGAIAFICFCYLRQRWSEAAPHLPNVGEGLIVSHDEHGFVQYFSAFQGTSCLLLLATSVPLVLVGHLIAPKKNMVVNRGRWSISGVWDRDDPAGLSLIGGICGVLVAPVIIFAIGPHIVRWLNAAGIVTGF